MDGILTLIVAAVALLGIMAVANIADRQGQPRQTGAAEGGDDALYDPDDLRAKWARQVTPWLLAGMNVLLLCNGISYLILASTPAALLEAVGSDAGLGVVPSAGAATGVMLISLLMVVAAFVLLAPQVRQAIARAQILSPAFNPDSAMHMVALVFAVYLIGMTGVQFALYGGDLAALGEEIGSFEDAVNASPLVGSLAMQAALFIAVAVVGVGFPQRRAWPAALRRLGLVRPTWAQVAIGVGAGVVMLMFQFIAIAVWLLLVGEETFAEQTRAIEAMNASVQDMGSALVIAALTATSEEIAFRGALQPVLGIGITSIVFAVIHLQYTLTPATLVILALAVVLGLLRQRFNTTTAVLCHFAYNFAGLAISVMSQNLLDSAGGLP
ncbi:MAG: hypothetical protein Kow00120_31140 [Anaerolineae bacterium]